MDASTLRKMLYVADGKVQSGIVAWGSLQDYETYKNDFKDSLCQSATQDAMDGTISHVRLSQSSSSKPKDLLVIPVIHCLTSDAKFSKVLEELNKEKYEGPYMFLPFREELYDPYNT